MKRSIIFFIVILQIIIFAQSIDWVSYPIDGFNAARGGAFLLYRNPSNLLYNPSTLVFSRQMGFSLSSGILAFGRKGISLGGYYKVYRGLTFFSGFMYNGVSGFEETLSDGSKTGSEFSVSRILGTGGFSFRFGRAPVSASIMFKYIYEDLYAASASGYGLKINVSGFTRFINFGVFMDNIVQVITWNDYEDKYPINFRVSLEKYIRKIGIDDLPEFDFIGLHGVWSWVSPENQKIIINFIRKKLKVGGVVYISYNTLPGWLQMIPLRELYQYQLKIILKKPP